MYLSHLHHLIHPIGVGIIWLVEEVLTSYPSLNPSLSVSALFGLVEEVLTVPSLNPSSSNHW